MANINKSFNFRNGVQVDNDNFIVNPNGLVGIGTTIPTEILDVYGTTRITGLVTTRDLYVKNLSTFTEVRLGTGITMSSSSGIITATAFYGNGATLSNLPASQWIDIDVGLGFTSIYAAGNVGVATTNPGYTFQVGGNPNTSSGVGFNSTGSINATGIITAGYFSGDGSSLTSLNASNIASGTLNNARLPLNINLTGIATLGVTSTTNLTSQRLNVSGLSTFAGITTVTGPTLFTKQLNVSGLSTFFGDIDANGGLDVDGYTELDAVNISETLNVSGLSTFAGITTVTGSTLFTQQLGVSGVATVSTRLYAQSIGVGTNSPSGDIHIRKSSASTLQVTSDSAESTIAIGRSTTLTGNNGALRFGNTSGSFPYSNAYSLDILNYGLGNVNFYLEASNVSAAGTGSFYWHRKPNFAQLMTLTYDGNLGIGITLPTNTIHVSGTSTVTSDSYVGGNLYVNSSITTEDLTVTGTPSFTGGSISADVTGDVTGNLSGNVYASSGVSTFTQTRINTRLGIGTNASVYQIEIGQSPSKVVISNSAIGINTTIISDGVGVDCQTEEALFRGIGIGTTSINFSCYVDFSNAGVNDAVQYGRYMLPPTITTAERNFLTVPLSGQPFVGALIYNKSVNRLEVWNGSGWCGIATVEGA
jgi:cytoskeletal protein CcmA (bactofilin family)